MEVINNGKLGFKSLLWKNIGHSLPEHWQAQKSTQQAINSYMYLGRHILLRHATRENNHSPLCIVGDRLGQRLCGARSHFSFDQLLGTGMARRAFL